MTAHGGNALVGRVTEAYLARHPGERGGLAPLLDALRSGHDVGSRLTFPLHVTAGAVVLDPGHGRVLLVHHVALGIWVQPGGHLEPGETPLEAATRELREECGDVMARPVAGQGDVPFDVDVHPIPTNPRRGEPAHLHCDLRYLLEAVRTDLTVSDESHDARWVTRGADLLGLSGGRMARIGRRLDEAFPRAGVRGG